MRPKMAGMKLHRPARRPAGALPSGTAEAHGTNGTNSTAEQPEGESVLLVTEDSALRDEVALIAAVVGVQLEITATWPGPGEQTRWAAMMCSPQSLPPTAGQAQGTLLLGHSAEALWEAAALMPGLRPAPLPQAENWLSEQLSAQVFDRSQGTVIAAVSTAGGVGATTFAYLCAAELAARGARPLLIDAAPGPGSGLADLVEQGRYRQQLSGGDLDWDQLNRTEGEISASHLSAALPVVDGIAVLTDTVAGAQRTPLLPAAVAAGRTAFDAVIIDSGQRADVMSSLGEQLEKLLVVARASRRAVDSARRVLRGAAPWEAVVALNRRAAPGWGPHEVAEELSAPVAADLAEQKWLARSDDLSDAYELLRSARGASMIAELLDALGVDGA